MVLAASSSRFRWLALLVIATTATSGPGLAAETSTPSSVRRYIEPRSNQDQPPSFAFSGGVLVGSTLYLSGQLGLQADNTIPADPEVEARRVLDRIKAVLAEAGMTMDDLVNVQVFCTDLSLYPAFNRIYKGYFTREFPARSFIGTNQLLFGARFEVLGIAVKR